MSIRQGKLLKNSTRYKRFLKSLPWLGMETYVSKLSNILSQYCVQKCLMWHGPKTYLSGVHMMHELLMRMWRRDSVSKTLLQNARTDLKTNVRKKCSNKYLTKNVKWKEIKASIFSFFNAFENEVMLKSKSGL